MLSPQKPEGPQRNDSGGRPIDAVTDYEVGSFPPLPRPADLDGELIVYREIRGPFIRDGVDCHPGGLKCAGWSKLRYTPSMYGSQHIECLMNIAHILSALKNRNALNWFYDRTDWPGRDGAPPKQIAPDPNRTGDLLI